MAIPSESRLDSQHPKVAHHPRRHRTPSPSHPPHPLTTVSPTHATFDTYSGDKVVVSPLNYLRARYRKNSMTPTASTAAMSMSSSDRSQSVAASFCSSKRAESSFKMQSSISTASFFMDDVQSTISQTAEKVNEPEVHFDNCRVSSSSSSSSLSPTIEDEEFADVTTVAVVASSTSSSSSSASSSTSSSSSTTTTTSSSSTTSSPSCLSPQSSSSASFTSSSLSSSRSLTTSLCCFLSKSIRSQHLWLLLLLCVFSISLQSAESCSSRSTPKPRPPTPTTRPNITFQTYACPEAYAKWYCLNGATCFSVRIGESILYNCECADGYMGQRCEFKDLDGSYLRKASREKILVETAGIAGGVTLAVLLVVLISISACTYLRNQETRLLDDQDDYVEEEQRLPTKPLSGLRLLVPGTRGSNYGSTNHHFATSDSTSNATSTTNTDCSQCVACLQSKAHQRNPSQLSPSLSPSLFATRSFFNV